MFNFLRIFLSGLFFGYAVFSSHCWLPRSEFLSLGFVIVSFVFGLPWNIAFFIAMMSFAPSFLNQCTVPCLPATSAGWEGFSKFVVMSLALGVFLNTSILLWLIPRLKQKNKRSSHA